MKIRITQLNLKFAVAVVTMLFIMQTGSADDDKPISDNKALDSQDTKIGNISVQVGDVFDLDNPKENNFLFRFLNLIHIKTREQVIRNELLFESGEPYSSQLLEESERNLRSATYIYDARVKTADIENNEVDILVRTRDAWSLVGGFTYSQSGGENQSSFFIEDKNLLGFGSQLRLKHSSDVDRDENQLSFRDRNLFGERLKFGLDYANNSDGYIRGLELSRPFYALNVGRSYGAKFLAESRTDTLYADGVSTDRYQHDIIDSELSVGFSQGLIRNRTLRWGLGATYSENHYEELPDEILTNPLPENKAILYPWVNAEYIQNRFEKMTQFDHIQRTEDVNIGREVTARLGWSPQSWGSDHDGFIIDAKFSDAYGIQADQLFLWSLFANGRPTNSGIENLNSGISGRFYMPNLVDQVFNTELSFDLIRNLDDNSQLLLGGDTGLRGYPNRIQSGNRRFLYTAEQRLYTNWHVFQLVYVGGLVFFDAGSAWVAGDDKQKMEILSDIGLGLRLASSRSATGKILHIDMAFPLNGDETTDQFQLIVTTKGTF